MAFCAYRSRLDGRIEYAFSGEEDRIASKDWEEEFERLPPNPTVIIATKTYMAEQPLLDSFKTMYELDRVLNIEAEQEREDKAYQMIVTQN